MDIFLINFILGPIFFLIDFILPFILIAWVIRSFSQRIRKEGSGNRRSIKLGLWAAFLVGIAFSALIVLLLSLLSPGWENDGQSSFIFLLILPPAIWIGNKVFYF